MGLRRSWRVVVLGGALGGALLGCRGPEGRRLFADHCARCHGAAGGGGRPLRPGAQPPRDFRDVAFQRRRTDAELHAAIRDGRGTDMPPFKTRLDARQIDALVARVRRFAPGR